MLQEHERAVLTVDLPAHRLEAGDVGTIVHVYSSGNAYEVEFFALDGQTLDVITVESGQLRPVHSYEVMHSRSMEAEIA